jgi:hypothetical protein
MFIVELVVPSSTLGLEIVGTTESWADEGAAAPPVDM